MSPVQAPPEVWSRNATVIQEMQIASALVFPTILLPNMKVAIFISLLGVAVTGTLAVPSNSPRQNDIPECIKGVEGNIGMSYDGSMHPMILILTRAYR
jgi:hypothetical protein